MAESAFGFYRGAAAIMAADLAHTPASGLNVQLSGDAHCMNFGGFATPERNLLFDLNDFDETMPGPWEWDLKRLVTSIVVAARHNDFSARNAEVAALAATHAYRLRMQELAASSALEVWYARLDATTILEAARSAGSRRARTHPRSGSDRFGARRGGQVYGSRRRRATVVEDPPTLYHLRSRTTTTRRGGDRRHLRVEPGARRAGAARPVHAAGRGDQSGRRGQRRDALRRGAVCSGRRRRVHPANQRGAAVGAVRAPRAERVREPRRARRPRAARDASRK